MDSIAPGSILPVLSTAQVTRDDKAAQALEICRSRGFFIACAESLTAGLLADSFVRIPGASDVFLGSAVTYTNEEKHHVLGVSSTLLRTQGAVASETARQMASGVRDLYASADEGYSHNVIGLSTTGVAGPGPSEGKPEGLVYVACTVPGKPVSPEYPVRVRQLQCSGSRETVRRESVEGALDLLLAVLEGKP